MSLFKLSNEPELEDGEPIKSLSITTQDNTQTAVGKRASSARDVIGQITMGTSIHYASMGEWSAHDLLFHILDQTGPAHVIVATWSISEVATRQMIAKCQDGSLLSLAAVLDWRVKVRRPEVLELAKFNISNIRLTSCHAKITTIINDNWHVTIVGSANYTNNPRIEAGVIACDKKVTNFHAKWMTAELENAAPFEEEA